MKEIYNQIIKFDFDGKEYKVRLITDISTNMNGEILDASDLAKSTFVNYHRCRLNKDQILFEVEGLEKDSIKLPVSGAFYLGMVYDEKGNYLSGRHLDPDFGGGSFMPIVFFKKYGKMTVELGKKLPFDISVKIKDFYNLAEKEFLTREAKNHVNFEEWNKLIKKLGILN